MATVKSALHGKSMQTATRTDQAGAKKGLVFERRFTDGKTSAFDMVEWEKRTALIGNEKGTTIFRQEGVEVPKGWSQLATNVVVQKYFRGTLGTPQRESSVRTMVGRVADTIYGWGKADGYFKSEADGWAMVDCDALLKDVKANPKHYTPWFKIALKRGLLKKRG